MSYSHKSNCHVCSSTDLTKFLSLGEHPPVDNFIPSDGDFSEEKRFPLEVYFCCNCCLVQLLDVVSPEVLFHSDYAYFSSASEPLVAHFQEYAKEIKKEYLSSGDLVVDIGSNDGVLLQFLHDEYRVLGIEPSENVAMIAREKGIETVIDFLTPQLAEKIVEKYGKAKVVTANNVFAHIDDISEVVKAVKVLMANDGVYVFEVHYLLDLIQKTEFDTVYHEHLFYYSVKSLQYLFSQFDMEIFDVQRIEQHGGSIRVFVCNKNERTPVSSVQSLLKLEEEKGLHSADTFLAFQKKVESIKNELVTLVRDFNQQGKKVVGYGAPAKGNTLLNFCGFTEKDIAYITDTTPYKIGCRTPGSHIPVISPEILERETPDYILLLAWNYRDFILEKEKSLRERGAKFIIPVPKVEIV